MKIIGITGGIGSGKSTVCRVFETLNIPVFNADDEAKKLYDTQPDLLEKLVELFGPTIRNKHGIDRAQLASMVFHDNNKLQQLNALIHPRVGHQFQQWLNNQKSPYVIREAAILIESGSYKDCHRIILVSANESVRIERVSQRSGLTEVEIRQRMKRQWSDEQRRPYCHFEIENNPNQLILPVIHRIHQKLIGS